MIHTGYSYAKVDAGAFRVTLASRAKRYPLCFSGSFRRRKNCPLLVRGSAPETLCTHINVWLRVSAKRFRSMAVTGDHAPVSFPRCAHPCPAYDPRSACGAAARVSRHGRCGIRHTPPFFSASSLAYSSCKLLTVGSFFTPSSSKAFFAALCRRMSLSCSARYFFE